MSDIDEKEHEIQTDPNCRHCSAKGAVEVVRHGSVGFDPCRCAVVVPLTEEARKRWFGPENFSIGHFPNH